MRIGNAQGSGPSPGDDTDVAGVVRALDVMVRTDRLAAAEGLERRVVESSFAALGGSGVERSELELLAVAERNAATTGFEDRVIAGVMQQSRDARIADPGGRLRIAEEGTLRAVVRTRVWTSRWAARSVAAVLLIGVGGMITKRVIDSSRIASVPLSGVPAERLRAELDERFEVLLAAMSDVNLSGTQEMDPDSNTSWTEFLTEEGAS